MMKQAPRKKHQTENKTTMAETIDNIISEKAFEQIQRLLEELTKLDEKMVSAIDRVEKYRTALQNASGFKDTANGINNLQKIRSRIE